MIEIMIGPIYLDTDDDQVAEDKVLELIMYAKEIDFLTPEEIDIHED